MLDSSLPKALDISNYANGKATYESKNEFLKDEHHFMVIKDSMNNYYLDCKKSKWYFSDFKSLCRWSI